MAGRVLLDVVVAVLTLSLVTKCMSPRAYVAATQSYTIFKGRGRVAPVIASLAVFTAELAVVVLYVSDSNPILPAAVSLVLLTVLLLASSVDGRTVYDNCGCGGTSEVVMPKSAYRARGVLLATMAALATILISTSDMGLYPDEGLPTRVGRLLVALPLAALVLDLPLLLHMRAVEHAKLPEKVGQIRRKFAATHI